ncbi:septum formation family protein [Nocardioides sp. NPDC023903]|uniref:DUF4190 domain-containing protein n=1 Tax=Nocardioides sp. NPDC023903 TaxID=3157195 RepID=UPI0033C92BAC
MSNTALPQAHEQNQQDAAGSRVPSPSPLHERPTQAMAVAAFVLCCFLFNPVAVIIGIGLAITVLVQSKPTRNHGVRKAITAIVIGVCGLVLVSGLFAWLWSFTYGTNIDRDKNGAVTSSGLTVPDLLRVGDCFDDDNPVGEPVFLYTIDVVPCSEPHQWEAYHHFNLADGPWPGDNEVAWLADPWCRTAFHGFIGEREGPSDLRMDFYVPSEVTWQSGDRHVVCYLGTGSPTTDSLRGSAWRDTP